MFDNSEVSRVVDVSHLFSQPERRSVIVPSNSQQSGEVATYVVISRMLRTPDHATTWVFTRTHIDLETLRRFVLANPEQFGDDTVVIDTGARQSVKEAMKRMPDRSVGPPHTNGLWLADFNFD